jgi:transglutaminase-like putative cysteine protease
MVACLRSLGLPARYVSGYLLTQPAPGQRRLIGNDASHAWAAVYLPDLEGVSPSERWHDFDPTNNRDGWGSPGEDYVTLAVGRDFGDVSPIRGVIHGGAHHTLTVGVTVEPYGIYDANGFGTLNAGQSQSQSQSQPGSQSQSQSQSQSP